MVVYYFTSLNYALSNIALKRLKISRLIDLNDPFELLGPDIRDSEIRRKYLKIRDHINDTYGVICFSKSWENPVLWSHYGDRHRGICLGMELPSNGLREINYIGERYPFEFNKKGYIKLLLTKYKAWEYENELRKIVKIEENDSLQSEDDLLFYPIRDKIKLKKVILGPRCNVSPVSIKNLVSNLYSEVEIIVSRLAFGSFEVIPNKVKTKKLNKSS